MDKYVTIRVRVVDDAGADSNVEREWWEGRFTGVYGSAEHPRYIQFDEGDIVEGDE